MSAVIAPPNADEERKTKGSYYWFWRFRPTEYFKTLKPIQGTTFPDGSIMIHFQSFSPFCLHFAGKPERFQYLLIRPDGSRGYIAFRASGAIALEEWNSTYVRVNYKTLKWKEL
jgi:hypothetical protein